MSALRRSEILDSGRRAFERQAWSEAYKQLSTADRHDALVADDLERLAVAAYLLGRDENSVSAFDRAYRLHVYAESPDRAARCAFWLGLTLLLRGEAGAATGWLSRGQRRIGDLDCVEQGYLSLPVAELQLAQGNADSARETAAKAMSIGEQFADADLIAIAQHLQGRALIQQWHVREGLALLDEAMVAATADELSPIVTGLIYCSVIEVCQQTLALERAREWTSSFARWCSRQTDLVAFTATCLVCRSEVLQLTGHWADAMKEAKLACQRPGAPARAFYQQAEVHRLRGEFDEAEAAYCQASEAGCDPQPGLCLLRLAQNQAAAAGAMIRRTLQATADRGQRAKLLPAYVEAMLALKQQDDANTASDELTAIASDVNTDTIRAMAAQVAGTVALTDGDATAAIRSLRTATQIWEQIGVLYESGRSRVLIGLACRELADDEGARLEFDGARAIFERLGATAELRNLQKLTATCTQIPRGLSNRELQVLRLVAAGHTNKAIAQELHISQKTVDRHVSNIFTKLNTSTRTAAAAFAYEHNLV